MEHYANYQYSLDLFSRINTWVEKNPSLAKHFLYRNYSMWQTYQQPVFADILLWSKDKNTQSFIHRHKVFEGIKILVFGVFACTVSFVAILMAIIKRKKIGLFTGDKVSGQYHNDFRINSLYEAVIETQTPYVEVVHAVMSFQVVKNFFKRKRFVIYLETIDLFSFFFVRFYKLYFSRKSKRYSLDEFSPEERHFIRVLLSKYASFMFVSKRRTDFFRILFSVSFIQSFFSIDDVRHYNEVVLASLFTRVSFYAVQHGHYTKYHVGWYRATHHAGDVIKPTAIIVWSEHWKNELLRLKTYFTSDQIIIGGNKDIPSFVTPIQSEMITVLMPYETQAPKHEVFEYVKKILAVPNVRLVFKVRSDHDTDEQVHEYGLTDLHEKIVVTDTIKEMMSEVSLVIGTYSTFLYDMVAHGIPVLMLRTSINYGEGMVTGGFAQYVSIDDSFDDILKENAELSLECRKERRNKLIGDEKLMLKQTIKNLLQLYV